jgi:hypothetical protein
MRNVRRRERGESKFGCTVALLVLILVVGVGFKVVPALFSNNELADSAERLAGQAVTKSGDDIQRQILAKAKQLEIREALVPGAITVTRDGGNAGMCVVTIHYTRKLDFYGVASWDLTTDKNLQIPYSDFR